MEARQDRTETLRAFQSLLDASWEATEPRVELTALRKLCAKGIPNRPQHLRPLAYSLLLETVPPEKRSWKDASKADRERYYKLVQSFMEDLLDSPPPSETPLDKDNLLTTISRDVNAIASRISLLKRRTVPSRRSPFYPPPRDDTTSPITQNNRRNKPVVIDAGISESSSSDSERDEITSRTEDYKSRKKSKGKEKAVEHMGSRRAPFFRLEQMAIAEHKTRMDSRRKASGSGSTRFDSDVTPRAGLTDEQILSPRITLSPEEFESPVPMPSIASTLPPNPRLSSRRPSQLQTPQLSLSVSDDSPTSNPGAITLLSPQPIPIAGSAQFAMISGSLLYADTHAECLVRLLYSFCHSHPQWKYKSHFVDILTPLYLVFTGPAGKGKWAEEQTFWAFAATMGELGEIIAADEDGLSSALERLSRRVKWADYDLFNTLKSRNLDPAVPLYAYRWMTSLFCTSLPPPSIFPIWDLLLAEEPRTTERNPKLDLLVDICVALLILCKPRLNGASVVVQKQGGLWGDDDDDGVDENEDDAFVTGLNLLRDPPLSRIGGVESLLQIAFKLRQARMVAALSGDDPDGEAALAQSTSKQTPSKGITTSKSWTTSLSLPSISQYAPSIPNPLPSSETTASIAKNAAGWTSAAKARLSGAGQVTAASVTSASSTASTGLTAAASRLWGSWRGQAQPQDRSLENDLNARIEAQAEYGSNPSTPPKFEQPPRFVEPKNTVRYPQLPASLAARRERSDTNTSTTSSSMASLSEKFSSFASSLTGATSVTSTASAHGQGHGERSTSMSMSKSGNSSYSSPTGPRPLLLSGSARRASGSSQANGAYADRIGNKRDSTSSSISSPPPSETLSPPRALSNSVHVYGNGNGNGNGTGASMSRGASLQGLGRTPQSSLLMELNNPRDGSDNPLGFGIGAGSGSGGGGGGNAEKPIDGGPLQAAGLFLATMSMSKRRIPPKSFLASVSRSAFSTFNISPTRPAMFAPAASMSISRAVSSTTAVAAAASGTSSNSVAGPGGSPRLKSNYEGHIPLTGAQNALMAVGSGIMGVLDTTRGDLVATLSETTASTFLPNLHASMSATAEGRQILRNRPVVSSQTVDLGMLKGLKRGTLGREYVEWLERGDLSPDSRAKVQYIDSPTLAYTMLRYRQTHDLYHTLFSLPPTLVHELTLKVVELANMSLPVAGLSSAFGPLRLSSARRQLWRDDWVPWALRTGGQGRSLVSVYWEKRWEQGLGELRRELGVRRNELQGVESRWRGYRELREMEREGRKRGEWVDEPEEW